MTRPRRELAPASGPCAARRRRSEPEIAADRARELRAQDVQEELERSGKIVRRKARDLGEAVTDAAADTAITAEIKAKLAIDPDRSAAAITVNTTSGRVTPAGSASSPEAIGKAVLLALETKDVREVVPTLQAKQ